MADRTCNFDSCERKHYAKGWCYRHYLRVRRTGTPADPPPREPKLCGICGAVRGRGSALGLCGKHYQRYKTHGDPFYDPARPRVVGVEICAIEGCEGVIQARGWCSAHWSRWRRHGSPTAQLRGEAVEGKRICAGCGTNKPLTEWAQSWCYDCTRERQKEYSAERRARLKSERALPWLCAYCGDWFMGNKKQRRYCCRGCADADRHRMRNEHSALRRARRRNLQREPIEKQEIFIRDGWSCHLCGEGISRDLAWPHPMSASMDHIIPLSRGGSHTRENVAAAHLVCNLRKHASIPE